MIHMLYSKPQPKKRGGFAVEEGGRGPPPMPRSLPRKNPENFAAHRLLIGGLKIHSQYALKSHYYWLYRVFCRFGKSGFPEIILLKKEWYFD